jgi:RNA polymerase primary sigma factor
VTPPRASSYLCRPIADLAEQLVQATVVRCHDYVRRAEKLHDQIDPEAAYPIDFVAYRITGQRHLLDSEDDAPLLTGAAVAVDLRQLVDDLSRRHPLPLLDEEPTLVAEDLATRLNVSTKTLSRWRKQGLRWRWCAAATGQRHLAFTQQAIDRFAAANARRVERASRFTQMSPDDRERLIERARRLALARPGLSLNQVATHLSRRIGRAVETIRLLLEQHDAKHPQDRIFADHTGPLTGWQRRVIARAHRMGVPVSKIARRFRRAHSTIYRAIQDRRAAVIRRLPITYVASRTFERDDADVVILRPPQEGGDAIRAGHVAMPNVDDLPAELRPLYQRPTLDPAAMQSLFVRFNYLKFKAAGLRDRLDRYEPRAGDLDRIEAWLKDAAAIRDRLVLVNLPVVLSVARRHLLGQPHANPATLVTLLEVGNQVLFESIDAYDFARDRTFESYLTFVLMRRFASSTMGPRRAHRRLSGVDALRRLQDKAGESGIMLALRDDDQDTSLNPPA